MDLAFFLAHAVKLEQEAELIYRRSAEAIDESENVDAVAFFWEMAGYSRLHLQEVARHAEAAGLSQLPPSLYRWSADSAPEALVPAPVLGDIIDLDSAMKMALNAERRAVAFYEEAACPPSDPEVRTLAKQFAAEERGHVLALERFLGIKPY